MFYVQGAVMLDNSLAVNKSDGLQHLAEQLGFQPEEFCVWGDEANDWAMFDWAVSAPHHAPGQRRNALRSIGCHALSSNLVAAVLPAASCIHSASVCLLPVMLCPTPLRRRAMRSRRPMLSQRRSVGRAQSPLSATTMISLQRLWQSGRRLQRQSYN